MDVHGCSWMFMENMIPPCRSFTHLTDAVLRPLIPLIRLQVIRATWNNPVSVVMSLSGLQRCTLDSARWNHCCKFQPLSLYSLYSSCISQFLAFPSFVFLGASSYFQLNWLNLRSAFEFCHDSTTEVGLTTAVTAAMQMSRHSIARPSWTSQWKHRRTGDNDSMIQWFNDSTIQWFNDSTI